MTKAGKVLTVFLVFASVAFMGFAGVSSMTQSDWKSKAAELNEKIKKQTDEIAVLEPQIEPLQLRLKEAIAANAADLKAMLDREQVLLAELQKLSEAASTLSAQAVSKAKEVQAKRDESALRRDEGVFLRNQLDELRTEKQAALDEERRLTDLLIQTQGTLERVQRRNELLGSTYDPLPPPENKKP